MPSLTTKYDIFLFPRIQTKENEAFSLPVFTSLTPHRDHAWFLGRRL